MWSNFRTTLSLLWHQNTGSPYDILLPWGLFYDIGRIFIVIGVVALVYSCIRALIKKEFSNEMFILIPLIGGGINCLLVTPVLHQINSLYIPLVLCEAYGIMKVLSFLKKKVKCVIVAYAETALILIYVLCLVLFQKDYYTDYKNLVNAYFAKGLKECVLYAERQCQENNLDTITVEKGAQWPRLLLFTETLPSQYLSTVEYDEPPAPKSFVTNDGLTINTRINYDNISQESVYIIYYTDVSVFENDFDIIGYDYWYVAVPKL
jgi:hypothetical protein